MAVSTLLVLTIPGRRFYLKGFPALARLAPDMNSLVAVGTAAVIVALILLGRFLEARAKGRTSEAIKHLVEQAQGSKLPIQAVVDKVTLWFVPMVMFIAALTFVVWLAFGPSPALTFALINGVAVLIIACPCAMGLATPTSIMMGTGRGEEMGVLFRKGEALQLFKDAKVVAVDKTGTLTGGRPVLTDLDVAEGFERREALAKVAAVESRSEHPIARAS